MEAQAVMMVPLDSFNILMEKVSSMEILLRDLRRQNGISEDEKNTPLTAQGYYYGDEIRRTLGWATSTWTNGKKSHLIVDGRMILERDPNNGRRYRCKRADLHKWMQINQTKRYNELFEE